MYARVVATLIALATQSAGAMAENGKFEPIAEEVSTFLQELFDKVPAPSISERIPQTLCQKDMFDEPMPGFGGSDLVGAYFCNIDFGCGQTDGAPVWFDADGALWFGPDSAERLVAMYCGDSISDPERRKALTEEVHQGG